MESFVETPLFTPIGHFHSVTSSKHRAPRQPDEFYGIKGYIELKKGHNFEQALQDLSGFSHIWIIYQFHQSGHWKPMVLPPRGDKKRGVFATRSPYRPNPIGLSLVELSDLVGLKVFITGSDLIDGTPIFDIKPYIPYADSIPHASAGWTDQLKESEYTFLIEENVNEYNSVLLKNSNEDILLHAQQILRDSPFPHPYRRIKYIEDSIYEVAVKEFRFHYQILDKTIRIFRMYKNEG